MIEKTIPLCLGLTVEPITPSDPASKLPRTSTRASRSQFDTCAGTGAVGM